MRLLGFVNIKLRELVAYGSTIAFKVEVTSYSPEEAKYQKLPIIQWVEKNHATEVELLTPRGTTLEKHTLLAEGDLISMELDSIVQFYRIGFARIDSVEKDKVTCIFAHD